MRWLHLVGRLEHALGLESAVGSLEECARLSLEVLGERDPLRLVHWFDLGRLYADVGRDEEALRVFEEELALSRQVLGDGHPNTLRSIENLGQFHFTRRNFESAISLLVEALTGFVERYSLSRRSTLQCMHSLGLASRFAGYLGQAEALFAALVRLSEDALGTEDEMTVRAMYEHAAVLDLLGRTELALAVAEDAWRRCGAGVTDLPRSVVSGVANSLATVYQSLGRQAEALALFEKAHEFVSRLAGDQQLKAATANNLAASYRVNGQSDRAIPLLRHALGWRSRTGNPGDGEDDEVAVRRNLIAAAADAEDFDTYLTTLRDAAVNARRTAERLGSDAASAMAKGIPNLATRLADALLKFRSPVDAVDALETVRAVRLGTLQQRSNRQLDDLRDLGHRKVVNRFRLACRQLETVEHLAAIGVADPERLRVRRREVDGLLDEIRLVAPDYGLAPTCGSIRRALRPETRVAYILPPGPLHDGTRVLTMTSVSEPVVFDVADSGFGQVRELSMSAMLLALGASEPGATADRRRSVRRLALFCGRVLWDALDGGLTEAVSDDVVVIPVGPLALLPWHAAARVDESRGGDQLDPLIAHCHVRTALSGAQLIDEADSARADPASPRQAGAIVAPAVKGLAFCAAEATAVSATRGFTMTPNSAYNRVAVAELLSRTQSVHTSCHGSASVDVATTALVLVDPPTSDDHAFLVVDAEQLRRKRRQEIFIAARSARTPGMDVPDEVLGFPNAFVGAGFQAVISAGWPVADVPAGLMTMRYHELRSGGQSPVQALRSAQLWLRDLTVPAAARFLRKMESIASAADLSVAPLQAARRNLVSAWWDQRTQLRVRRAGQPLRDTRVFDAAVHWGAFSLIGG